MGRHPPRVRPSIAAPLGLAVVLAVLLAVGDGAPWTPVVSDFAALGLSSYATVCAYLAARSAGGHSRAAWITMAAALGAWAIGDLIWALSEYVLHTNSFPSPADFFYLLFPVLAALAMAQFAGRHQSRPRIVLDGATVALCLFLLAWILALKDVYETYRDDGVALGLALVYPAADVVAVSVAIAVTVRADARQRVMLYLLAGALGLGLVTDSAFAYLVANNHYVSGTLIDIGWAAVLVMIAAAARLSGKARPPTSVTTVSVPSNSSLWLPYVPLLLAGTVGPAIVMTGLERVIVPFIVVTVCARQMVTAWENRRLLVAVAEQALKDPLTGLANQTLFNDRLAHAMMLRLRDNRSVAVVSLDLDDFKLVNDSLGHPTADSLLVHAGQRITECVRPGDTVARVGGDEFSVLLESEVDDSHLLAQQMIEAFNKPFVVDGQNLLMRPSVGVAVAPADEPDLAPDALIKRADIAMYTAKRSRSSRVHTFTADMAMIDPAALSWAGDDAVHTPGEGAAQVRLLGELRRAVDTGRLNVLYQPKYSLSTGRVVGVEALLRWPHPELGTLRPDAFMSLVRQHGLMRPVTDLVLDRVLDDAARWIADGAQMPVAVNLFAPFLHDTRLPGVLRNGMLRRGLAAELLTVEITEDLVLTELNVVTTVLRQLRQEGIRVAIDDFGSGYSALSYLRDLTVDEIKMDRRFIASVTTDSRAAAVVRAVIELAHALDSTVVAEGIEDAVTAAWLREQGCDIGQGFYFGKPIDAAGVPDLITVAAQSN
nr:bifunctional diguanylate cyclase/phosphodiesterase [Mycolicibacterium vanbaalenii]